MRGKILHRTYSDVRDWPGQAKKSIQTDDILFSEIRPANGRWAYVDYDADDFVVSTKLMVIRVVREVLLPRFLYLFLTSNKTTEWLQRLAESRSGTFPQITFDQVASLEIGLPPIEEQRAISTVISALDDKIESNRRLQNLGEQWIRCQVQRFLDSAVEGGAETVSLGEYCSLVRDGAKVGEFGSEDLYIGLEHMPRGSIILDTWSDASELGSNKSRFSEGDILFGKLRPYFRKVGVAPADGICSTDILVVRPKTKRDQALVAAISSSDALIDSLSAAATGTRMPRASWSDLASWSIPRLEVSELEELSALVTPLLEYLVRSVRENGRLKLLRDVLMPELLSGRLRVPQGRQEFAGKPS
ncbi:MAG: restriction endonuclease subunit S [Actinomycetota bacterium]|nr:restriction endonuclease subunit S [Actinomycetota bacterium]